MKYYPHFSSATHLVYNLQAIGSPVGIFFFSNFPMFNVCILNALQTLKGEPKVHKYLFLTIWSIHCGYKGAASAFGALFPLDLHLLALIWKQQNIIKTTNIITTKSYRNSVGVCDPYLFSEYCSITTEDINNKNNNDNNNNDSESSNNNNSNNLITNTLENHVLEHEPL